MIGAKKIVLKGVYKKNLRWLKKEFKIRPILCLLNHIITIGCSAAGLIYKANLPMQMVLPISLLIIVVTVFPGDIFVMQMGF